MPVARTRTRDTNRNADASSSRTTSIPKHKHHKRRIHPEPESNAAPGVQKLKAALRQTRRLLAKDKLAANVRVETERRLKGLEAELQQAELSKKERALALRYHKIKFFERQKVTRKIKQTKKRIESAEDKMEKKKASAELKDLRIDLNYVLHYPKMKKYISLFPPDVRKGEEALSISEADSQGTKTEREEVRKWIRDQMELGDLPSEPELNIIPTPGGGNSRPQKWPTNDSDPKLQSESMPEVVAEKDDFFGEDDEESS